MLCMGLLCHAFPNPKDTIYTNVETLMKEVRTTKNKTATYYLVLKDGEEKEVKVRIDLKQIDCEIPIFKSESFDIKKLMALKEESLTEPNLKLQVIDTKSKEWKRLTNEVKTLTKERDALKADTLSLDSTAIAKTEADLQDKVKDFKKVDAEVTKLFNEYEAMMDSLMGNLRTQYKQRLVAAMEEAYEKIENKETTFKSVDDDGTFWDIRLDLLKIDATREMKIPRRKDGGDETTEKITAGKFYYILHFAEFGTMFEEEKVKKVFSAIKLWEFHLNPYLVDKKFGLVCGDQYRTQHYINSVVDYKNYEGSLVEEEEFADNNPLAVMELRKFSGGYAQEYVGKFGCVRYFSGYSCSHDDPLYAIQGKNKAHMGVDLLAPINTEVFSAVEGIAYVYPGEIRGYGKTISVKGKLKNLNTGELEEIYVMYAHLNNISIENGASVKVGDVLGRTGITGNGDTKKKDERHLHLEILTQKWPSSAKGFSIRKPPLQYFKVINP